MSKECERIQIESWSQFREYLVGDIKLSWPLYRGQSDPNWGLSSSYERYMIKRLHVTGIYPYKKQIPQAASTLGEEFYTDRKKYALKSFIQLSSGAGDLDLRNLSEFEGWIVGRHYGLTTPILDWSTSPYVSSWFAYRDMVMNRYSATEAFSLDGFVSVWELDVGKLESSDNTPHLEIHEDPKIPLMSRSRIQSSMYTELVNHEIYDLEGYLISTGMESALKQILLPIKAMGTAMKDLSRMNIHSRTMFDDLAGAAEEANLRAFKGNLYIMPDSDPNDNEKWE